MKTWTIYLDETKDRIAPEIYGHFSEHLGRCIYGGLYVGEQDTIEHIDGMRKDAVEALRAIDIPVLRWPGGCFADEYHWRDGIGPKNQRKRMINNHWGGVLEDNSFGTHEFLRLCELLECEPYVNANVGSGTVQEMQEWVEYMTFDGESPMTELRVENGREEPWKVKYLGIGNENWGCGGNMRAEFYADLYRRFQTYVRSYSDNRIFKIACGPSVADYHWTEVMMREASKYMDGLTLHHYTVPYFWAEKGAALDVNRDAWYRTMFNTYYMEDLIRNHSAIMDRYDPQRRIALMVDEWGSWYDVEPGTNPGFLYQQSTIRDAVITAVNLHIFQDHASRVRMGNIAQTVNVLQSLLLTEEEKMLLTPTYHIFRMFKDHQGAMTLANFINPGRLSHQEIKEPKTLTDASMRRIEEGVPQLSTSASYQEEEGLYTFTITNLSMDSDEQINLHFISENTELEFSSAEILAGDKEVPGAHNTFDAPDTLKPAELSIKGQEFNLPAMSVAVLRYKAEEK